MPEAKTLLAYVVVDEWQYDGGEEFLYACTSIEKACAYRERMRAGLRKAWKEYHQRYGRRLLTFSQESARLNGYKIHARHIDVS